MRRPALASLLALVLLMAFGPHGAALGGAAAPGDAAAAASVAAGLRGDPCSRYYQVLGSRYLDRRTLTLPNGVQVMEIQVQMTVGPSGASPPGLTDECFQVFAMGRLNEIARAVDGNTISVTAILGYEKWDAGWKASGWHFQQGSSKILQAGRPVKPGPPPPTAAAPETFNFGVVSVDPAQRAAWESLLGDMARQTGLPIKPYFASDAGSLASALKFNQVRMAWLPPTVASRSVKAGDGELIAHAVSPQGPVSSVILIRAGSPITLAQLLGCGRKLSIGMGDDQSLAGSKVPNALLFRPKGVTPATCFKSIHTGSYQENARLVAAGGLDASTSNTTALAYMPADARARLSVIWTSPPLPDDVILWKAGSDPVARQKVVRFLTAYGTAPGDKGNRERSILAALSVRKLDPASAGYLSLLDQVR